MTSKHGFRVLCPTCMGQEHGPRSTGGLAGPTYQWMYCKNHAPLGYRQDTDPVALIVSILLVLGALAFAVLWYASR